jgi:phosphoribosylpyrophosphate synthetase
VTNGDLKRGFITPEAHAAWPEEMKARRGLLSFAHTRSGKHLAEMTQEEYNRLLIEHGSSSENFVSILDIEHRVFDEGEHIPRINSTVDGTDVFLFTAPYDPGYAHAQAVSLFASLEAHGFIAPGKTLDEFLDNHPKKDGVPPPIKVFGDAVRTKLLNGNMHETYNTVRTLADNGATVTVVMPYHAYGRQNKPTRLKREAAIARLVADLLFTGAGADGLMTYDPHAPDLHGFLPAGITKKLIDPFSQNCRIFEEYRHRPNVAFAYLDEGCKKRYGKLVEWLGLPSIDISKLRKEGVLEFMGFSGDVDQIDTVLFADDIVGTGSTLVSGLGPLAEKGIGRAVGSISHALLLGSAPQKMMQLYRIFEGNFQLNIQDSMPQPQRILSMPMIREWQLAPLQAQIINAVHYQQSASQFAHVYNGNN